MLESWKEPPKEHVPRLVDLRAAAVQRCDHNYFFTPAMA